MINAGKYNKKIVIFRNVSTVDADGFPVNEQETVLETWANVKTTKGYTLLANNSDFEKAFTNFTIRFPLTEITRKMFIRFNGKEYSIEYLNNINEENTELEIQAKEVTH